MFGIYARRSRCKREIPKPSDRMARKYGYRHDRYSPGKHKGAEQLAEEVEGLSHDEDLAIPEDDGDFDASEADDIVDLGDPEVLM